MNRSAYDSIVAFDFALADAKLEQHDRALSYRMRLYAPFKSVAITLA